MHTTGAPSAPSFPVVVDYERLAKFEAVLKLRDQRMRARWLTIGWAVAIASALIAGVVVFS